MSEFFYLFYQLHWYDLLDILLVTSMVVWLYSWVRGTRAFRVLLGLGLVVLIYFWAQSWGLFLTQLTLQGLGQAILILLIVIFAPEIRRVLERLNPMRIWNRPDDDMHHDYVDEMVGALKKMAEEHTGALLVIEREDAIKDLVRTGIKIDCEIQKEVLLSLFQHHSPTHDGAAWIIDGRVSQVGVFLPISESDLPLKYGSRHRAALGISEISDALVLVVSEERGEISLVEKGELLTMTDIEALSQRIREQLGPQLPFQPPTLKGLFLREWRVKLVTLLLVTAAWLFLAGQQQVEEIYSVPVEVYNLPGQLRLESGPVEEASLRLSGPRLALARLSPDQLRIRVDLSRVSEGTNLVPVDVSRILTPPNVTVTSVDPPILNIEAVPAA